MRFCGIDVSAKPANQQLCTLSHRQGELIATFFHPGTVDQVARTIEGFGRGGAVACIDAPSAFRLDLLAAGAPAREGLGLPEGRYERMRVCDALLFRRGLPLYPVPSADQRRHPWDAWMDVGFALFDALEALGRFSPWPVDAGFTGRVGAGDLRHGLVAETFPDAVFCALLGHRPSPKQTPWGLQQRIEVLRARGVVDADGGLWHRTLDELDACAAAYAAYAMSRGEATWLGAPEEGVIVLPTTELLPRYEKLPAPMRHALA